MLFALKDLAEVRAGHPFRGSVPQASPGNARVIQMRDISPGCDVPWDALVRTHIAAPHKPPNWLRDGDVLFVARGGRNYAIGLDRVPPDTVCSQYFYVLRCKRHGLLPDYLAWYINRTPCRQYLMRNAEGSDQLSIRRAVLERLPVVVPHVTQQRSVIALASASRHERRHLQTLIHNRERQLDAIAQHLLAAHQHH